MKTNKTYAGKIISKSRLLKPHQRQKVSLILMHLPIAVLYTNASNFSVNYGKHVCIAFSYWGCYEIIVKMTMVMT